MDIIERMQRDVVDGDFSEKQFDESWLSELETEFAHYLAASSTSAKSIELEKKKIGTLIADISHQTKMPVANLLLYSELLCEEGLC